MRDWSLRRIVVAYTLSKLATWFGIGALTLTVFSHTHSAVWVSGVLIAPLIPALLAPALVARAEAWPRRGSVTVLNCIGAVTAVCLALLLWHFWLPGVLALVAVNGPVAAAAGALLRSEAARASSAQGGMAITATGPAGAAVAPAEEPGQAPAEHRANASLNLALALTAITGPALAGVVVEGLGGPIAMCIVAAMLAVCGALVAGLRPYVEEADSSVRARLGAVRSHLRADSRLRGLLLTQVAALIFFESGFPIEVVYARSTLHAGDSGWGVLLAVWGAGMVVGSVVFARSPKHLSAMLTAGTLAVGIAYVGFAAAPSLRIACAAALAGGIGNGVQWASLLGAVQRVTPAHLLGRTMGAVEAIGTAAPLLGLVLGGALTAVASPRVAFLTMGLGACATTVAFLSIDATPESSRAPVTAHPEAVK
jgi:MFS family permease